MFFFVNDQNQQYLMVLCCQEEESDSSRVECMALNSASTSSDSESEVSEVKYFLRQNIFI